MYSIVFVSTTNQDFGECQYLSSTTQPGTSSFSPEKLVSYHHWKVGWSMVRRLEAFPDGCIARKLLSFSNTTSWLHQRRISIHLKFHQIPNGNDKILKDGESPTCWLLLITATINIFPHLLGKLWRCHIPMLGKFPEVSKHTCWKKWIDFLCQCWSFIGHIIWSQHVWKHPQSRLKTGIVHCSRLVDMILHQLSYRWYW